MYPTLTPTAGVWSELARHDVAGIFDVIQTNNFLHFGGVDKWGRYVVLVCDMVGTPDKAPYARMTDVREFHYFKTLTACEEGFSEIVGAQMQREADAIPGPITDWAEFEVRT